MKEQQFKEQQKRLREFSAIGGRKMDADSFIEAIVGPNKPSAPTKPGMGQQPAGLLPQTGVGSGQGSAGQATTITPDDGKTY